MRFLTCLQKGKSCCLCCCASAIPIVSCYAGGVVRGEIMSRPLWEVRHRHLFVEAFFSSGEPTAFLLGDAQRVVVPPRYLFVAACVAYASHVAACLGSGPMSLWLSLSWVLVVVNVLADPSFSSQNCVIHWCCHPCALCQEARKVTSFTDLLDVTQLCKSAQQVRQRRVFCLGCAELSSFCVLFVWLPCATDDEVKIDAHTNNALPLHMSLHITSRLDAAAETHHLDVRQQPADMAS
jgi:hypothetical protein